jgi:hypothetical protein
MIDTKQFIFKHSQTGVVIDRETKILNNNALADSNSTYINIYTGLARLASINKNPAIINENNKQLLEDYVLYMDRSLNEVIKEGDRITFIKSKIGQNELFVNVNNDFKIIGYIKRIVFPNAQSRISRIKFYISTNN